MTTISRPSHILLILQPMQPLQPLRIKIFSENLGHKTWRMWLGREIVVFGLPPLDAQVHHQRLLVLQDKILGNVCRFFS